MAQEYHLSEGAFRMLVAYAVETARGRKDLNNTEIIKETVRLMKVARKLINIRKG